MTRPLTVGSLCTGYGGLEMALNLLFGPELIDVRWHAETDPDASAVLKRWYPDVANLGDFTSPGFWDVAEPTEVQIGGIPCQPFSAAGRKKGTADPRYVWPAWLTGIGRHRPRMVVFENVISLVQGRMRTAFDSITDEVRALGYDVRWCLLGACAVGAAHHRHRVFLIASKATVPGPPRQVPSAVCDKGRVFLPTPAARDGTTWGRSDTKYQTSRRNHRPYLSLNDAVQLLPAGPGRWDRYAQAIALHTAILERPAPEPTEIGPRGGSRLTAAFSEWVMMLPPGHLTSVLGRDAALTRAGNGVVPRQAATALALLLTDLTGEDPPWSG
jgi:DNA (cytosine-5)-methyltransferase 1